MRLCGACRRALAGSTWHCRSCQWRAPADNGIPCFVDDAVPSTEGLTASQACSLAAINPRHFWYAARSALISWTIGRYAPHARTLLEVGCGTGHVLQAIAVAHPHVRLTGAETSPHAVRLALGLVPDADLIRADARRLPYSEEFDVIGAFDVLEHIRDDAAAMCEITRSARVGGTILLTVPQHPALWSPLDDLSGHHRRYTRRHVTALVRGAGLEVIRVTSFVSLLLPGLVLSRAIQRRVNVTPGREFDVTAAIDAPASMVMRLEFALIRYGLSLPAGGSLLVVARRRSP